MSRLSNEIEDLELLTEIATDLSMQFEGVNTNNRRKKISTYYLAKLVHNCRSLLKLLYASNNSNIEFFDFSSVASIIRNIIEATNLCWYYCLEDITEQESDFRLMLYDYHDICALLSICENLGFTIDDDQKLKEEKEIIKAKLIDNERFNSLNNDQQKQVKKGRKATLLNHVDMVNQRNIDVKEFQGIYKLLSTHIHSMPISINSVVYSILHTNEMDFVFCGLTLSYVSSFIADIIKEIGDLWEIEFAKFESKEFIDDYANNFRNIT